MTWAAEEGIKTTAYDGMSMKRNTWKPLEFRDNEYFTDVTLAAEGHTVKAHRVILSACSNYFHSILKNMGPWQHPVLLLQDVRPGDLTSLMDFIYFGQVNMNQDSLDGFLKIAEKLKIKGLCDT